MSQDQTCKPKLYVRIFPNLATQVYSQITRPTADESTAAHECLTHKGFAFKLLQVTTQDSSLKGQFAGAQCVETPFYYVGVDKIYTSDDVITELEDALTFLKNTPHDHHMAQISGTREAIKFAAEIFRQHNIPPAFAIRMPVSQDIKHHFHEYIWLKDGMKIFDNNARQIWPKTITSPSFQPPSP